MKEILLTLFVLSGIPTILMMVAWILGWITCSPIICFLPFIVVPVIIVASIGMIIAIIALAEWRSC